MKRLLILLLVLAAIPEARTAQPLEFLNGPRKTLLERMDRQSERFGHIAQRLWELAEVGYKEIKSAELLKSELRKEGFSIQDRVAEIPTAFMASWGQGKPVIGILGEFDALPGLYQEPVPEKKPLGFLGPGHGCGHNLFGAGSAFAAISVKDHLQSQRQPGTIRFYGCPAEEGGGGKIYMARSGAFNDCDIILHWHPGSENRASLKSNLANITAKFRFHGQAAHAAGAPDKGRSALDGVMLMTYAVEMLREHVPQTARIHYVVTHGGSSPNVVPALAEIYLYARHPDMETLDGIWSRILKCAEAGAMGSETKLEIELINSSYNLLPNDALAQLLDKNLREVGGIHYNDHELAFAQALRATYPTNGLPALGSETQIQAVEEGTSFGSTDVGDVSWIVPTGGIYTAAFVPGTPSHSWQSTACAGTSIGRKGMAIAAKALALSALDLYHDPKLIEAAKTSFDQRRAGKEYRSRLPASQKPPLHYRDR